MPQPNDSLSPRVARTSASHPRRGGSCSTYRGATTSNGMPSCARIARRRGGRRAAAAAAARSPRGGLAGDPDLLARPLLRPLGNVVRTRASRARRRLLTRSRSSKPFARSTRTQSLCPSGTLTRRPAARTDNPNSAHERFRAGVGPDRERASSSAGTRARHPAARAARLRNQRWVGPERRPVSESARSNVAGRGAAA
jgi:hypothetical protein